MGDSTGGTAYISVTAEEEPPLSYPIKVYSAILEDHEIATSAWGGYNGQEMMWIPVAFPAGYYGALLDFTGPYPQTISIAGEYTLSPTQHPLENLNIATFVQYASGTRECLNAHFMEMPDGPTGIEEGAAGDPVSPQLHAWPNPGTGSLFVNSELPPGVTGTVGVYDITGRIVESFSAGGTAEVTLDADGMYFVRLRTSGGEAVATRVTVIK